MGTDLTFSTAYHPQTGGQTERVNQIFEDMLRSCAIIYGKGWDECLPFLSFHTTIVTKQALGCHHLRLCMDGVVELLSIGRNPENEYILARTLLWRPRKK